MAKKHKPIFDIADLEKEYRKLIQTDPGKAKEIKKKIDFIHWGIE